MQVAFPSSPPANYIAGDDRFTEISMKLTEDFTKLEFPKEEIRNLERSWSKLEESVESHGESDEEDEDEEEEEFSFACVNAEGSPITADEAFEDGQIRPVFPLFNRDLLFEYENADRNRNDDVSVNAPRLRKLFVDDHPHGEAETDESEVDPLGPYCSWSGVTVEETSPETCRKSNSTGFSKLWRFRDLVLRSNSDGRDAFVFMNDKNQSSSSSSTAAKLSSEDDKKPLEENNKTKTKKGKDKTIEKRAKSAHEKLYMRNRAIKEEGKHRSYLPYKQVGFFTNVNGLSRNIHPF
ncbi:hypothetical protein AALP_AA1G257900 [Arabis alpina]|uniref:Uncharacterized protein n=1 Tax=Arabis alpina TaxID=50452 RepID=A0A087HQP5_ARAAL|nr:hypothetical protein AALP_AA1G257900 [Arabis alpina]